MEVKGSDGAHIGTVDRVEGDRIKLANLDPASGGTHQYMDLAQVKEIKDGCVVASKSAQVQEHTAVIWNSRRAPRRGARRGGAASHWQRS
jgi:hypothetical protein